MAQKVRLYRRSDVGSPIDLRGDTSGKVLQILRACLVDGYSIGTVSSITRVDNLVTVTMAAAHGLLSYGSYITIAGCDQPEYNGEWLVEAISTTQFTFTIAGLPATPATGTPTAFKAGAGWSEPFPTASNVGSFRQGAGNQFYLNVMDNQTYNTFFAGFENMTALSTGTQRFPEGGTNVGLYRGYVGTSNDWYLIATDTWFYMLDRCQDDNNYWQSIFFGDFESYVLQDGFNTALIGGSNTNSGGSLSYMRLGIAGVETSDASWCARHHDQSGKAVSVHRSATATRTTVNNTIGSAGYSYPEAVSSMFFVSPIYLQVSGGLRGKLPNLLGPVHARPHATYTWVDIDGATYLAFYHYNGGEIYIKVDR